LLICIIRKPRFGRKARVYYREDYGPKYYLNIHNDLGRSYILKTGFFSRYLLPCFPERKNIRGVSFIASDNKQRIFVSGSGLPVGTQIGMRIVTKTGSKSAKKKEIKYRLSRGQNISIPGTKGGPDKIYTYKV